MGQAIGELEAAAADMQKLSPLSFSGRLEVSSPWVCFWSSKTPHMFLLLFHPYRTGVKATNSTAKLSSISQITPDSIGAPKPLLPLVKTFQDVGLANHNRLRTKMRFSCVFLTLTRSPSNIIA